MTKIKKTLALLMVLVMAMTVLVLPASAVSTEEGVEPCAAYAHCPSCGTITAYYTGTYNASEAIPVVAYQCIYRAEAHNHYQKVVYERYRCGTCDLVISKAISVSGEYCPYKSAAVILAAE